EANVAAEETNRTAVSTLAMRKLPNSKPQNPSSILKASFLLLVT
ncbi:uncharacterized, partial [Tachysurus ichikawai]